MDNTSPRRALRAYRSRLTQRGIARFEVIGLDADRALIRQLARRLTTNDPDATRLRSAVSRALASEESKTGGILAALQPCGARYSSGPISI